ncbi:hypothetical protein GOB20_27930 [Sinorhizobium meliloti]|nr:hypothetical protein [Sinorhizobium meliloti]MDX0140743.1 hypothetical protein [Sinorhizobium meliloti]MDX0384080.1 hypothetical protein [Sinorhizobium meliloti]
MPLIRLPPPSPRKRGEGTCGGRLRYQDHQRFAGWSPLPACGERVRVRGRLKGRPRVHKVLPSLRYEARAATDRLRRGGPWRSRADANRDRAPAAG